MAATMAVLNAKCLSINSPESNNKPVNTKPTSLLSVQNFPIGLTISKPTHSSSSLAAGTAISGTIFSTLSSCDAAFAAQQIAEIADGDNRGIALLLPIIPAIGWVLFNILQPALNQVNRMRSAKDVIFGLGIGGLAATGLMSMPPPPHASASEVAMVAAEAASDNRGQLLLIVVTPAVLWVLYNILQPALNQINKMRSQ